MGERNGGRLGFVRGRVRRLDPIAQFEWLEERRRSLSEASEKWYSLLREMERNGESANAQYERYYEAYLEARHVEKRAELELFNLRHGLVR
jgi:hypothetical protein